jgi:outer membrane protein OmpA-like peptidoglycan-associated protein
MKQLKILLILIVSANLVIAGCSSWSKTAKGAVIGTAAGGAVGAAVGQAAGNPALGAIIGAAVGGTTGTIIGHHMDKQAEELKEAVPDATVERVGEGITIEFSSAVLFAVNKSDLSTEARGNLDKLVTVLNTYPDTNIEVQGHTDDTGTEAYNQTLSEKRAASVSDYLTEKGINTARVTTKGYGELAPKYDNTTDEGRTRNRRVEFLITANEKMITDAEKEAEK